ncbi:MAG TPA: MFS transporter [Pseudomonadales bacterium]|nr:MFS transporter [Pseudomonadales bacterium]
MSPSISADNHLSGKQLMLLALCMYCINMGQTLVFAILPALGREVGLREVQITLLISTSALVYSVMSVHWGRLSDRWGRRPLILLGLAGYSIGNVLFAGSFYLGLSAILTGTTFYVVAYMTRLVQSSIMSATNPAVTAYIADNAAPATRQRAYAKIGAATNLGTITGPAVAGFFASISLLAPLLFSSLLTFLALLGIAFMLPASRQLIGNSERRRLRYNDARYRHFILATLGIFLAYSSVQQTLAFTLQDSLGLNAVDTVQYTGMVLMLGALSSVFAQMVLIQGWDLSPQQFIRRGVTLMTIGLLIYASVPGFYALLVGMCVHGLGLGLAMPNIFSGASLSVEVHDQGAISGLISSVPAVGFILGPVIAGMLYEWMPASPPIFAVIIMGTTAIWLWWEHH